MPRMYWERMCIRDRYFLGDFDGEKFLCTCPSDEPRWLDEGFDNYAAVTFQNAKDVLLMGWGMNWQYACLLYTSFAKWMGRLFVWCTRKVTKKGGSRS